MPDPDAHYVELLERRHAYDGYGSPNTFVRLASQLGAARSSAA